MSPTKRRKSLKRRGQTAKAPSPADLANVVRETTQLWRKHHLGYDQTKYVVERVRRRLGLAAPSTRTRTVERLIATAYRDSSRSGLMIKTLFLTGARVSEFIHIRVEDLRLDSDPPQIHLTYAKGQSDRCVPLLPALAQELRTHLQGRRQGYLFESNRHTRYAVRTVQTMVQRCAAAAGLTKRVHPHLLRHSIATILLDSGQVPIDQVRKLGENYVRALGGVTGPAATAHPPLRTAGGGS